MLVLTRKKDEAIQIGEDIEVTVLAIEGDRVKLGIRAPRHVDIHRREVYLAIQEENNEASAAPRSLVEKLNQWIGDPSSE